MVRENHQHQRVDCPGIIRLPRATPVASSHVFATFKHYDLGDGFLLFYIPTLHMDKEEGAMWVT